MLPSHAKTLSSRDTRRKWLICLALAVAVVVAYAGVIHLGFVDYDDNDYITKNLPIQHGLNWASLSWAFTTAWAANWHPLTWIALTIDYSLFGANPTPYHVANVVWHLASSILLFLWLEYATRAVWRSAIVAAFFALHPFHVESVAWASERKDVLSAFFWMLSVWFYCAYARHFTEPDPRRARRFFRASLAAFVLGLLSKPMLVTLPFFLLLLDYWPLHRTAGLKRLVLEKIPFLVLSIASSVITIITQSNAGAVQSLVKFSLKSRLENTPVAYVRYLRKTFWPTGLNIFYLYVDHWGSWVVFASVLLLGVVTVLALVLRKRRPYLLVGWFWFLGVLVPAIGIIQVGEQSMADRYSYLSIVGLFIMVTWSVADFAVSRAWVRLVSGCVAAAALLLCIVGTKRQVETWRDTSSLFSRAVLVENNNYLAYYNLGCLMAKLHDPTNAVANFQHCLQYNPRYPRAYNNLAFLQIDAGQLDQAISNLQMAVQLRPWYPEAWMNLGRAYSAAHQPAKAKQSLETALRQNPALAEAYYHLGNLLLQQSASLAAATNLQAAVALQPRNTSYHLKLANAWVASQEMTNAVSEYEIALNLDPDLTDACNNLAWILAASPDASLRDGPLAVELARHAVALSSGKNPLLLGTFAAACAEAGNFDQAVRAADDARQLALAQSNHPLAASLAAQINLYRARQPFRDAHIK